MLNTISMHMLGWHALFHILKNKNKNQENYQVSGSQNIPDLLFYLQSSLKFNLFIIFMLFGIIFYFYK